MLAPKLTMTSINLEGLLTQKEELLHHMIVICLVELGNCTEPSAYKPLKTTMFSIKTPDNNTCDKTCILFLEASIATVLSGDLHLMITMEKQC